MSSRRTSSVPKEDVVFPRILYCDSRCSQTLPGLSPALPGALLCNVTRLLGDEKHVILRQRVRGSVRAIRAVRNTRVFQTETRVVADPSTIQPAPTNKAAYMLLPAPGNEEGGTIMSACTETEVGRTPEKPTYPKYKGTQLPHLHATPTCESSSSNNDINNEEQIGCFLECLYLNLNCMRMFDNETKMLMHYTRTKGNQTVPSFQQAVHNHPELFVAADARIAAAAYVMREVVVRFNTRLGYISNFAICPGKRMADIEGGRRKQLHKE